MTISTQALDIAAKVEAFVRGQIFAYEQDLCRDHHGAPTDELVMETRALAREAAVLTPHIRPDGGHFKHRETAVILINSGLTPLSMLACNTQAPDECNMYLIGHVGSHHLKNWFLKPLVDGTGRSAFFMIEPAELNGAGADPLMMIATCHKDGNHWVINRKKCFITGADGAKVGVVMAMSEEPDSMGEAYMFLFDLPEPAMRITSVPKTIDSSMPRSQAEITIDSLHVPADQMLGDAGEGF